jgi:RNA polymerase sigma factor (sigma-70 family)
VRSITNDEIQKHAKLVHKIARRLYFKVHDNAVDYDDLYAEGMIGLMKALEAYDPKSGNRFSTFAYPTIRGTINTFLDSKALSVRYPLHVVRLGVRISMDGAEESSPEEIAERYGVTEFRAKAALKYLNSRKALSIDRKQDEDDRHSRDFTYLAAREDDFTAPIVNEFLESLKPIHREVAVLLMQGYQQKEIAERLGVSRQGISQRIEVIRKEYEKYRKAEMSVKKVGKTGPDCGLTREQLLEAIARGETLASIERAWEMKRNTIHDWVRKWGLKGITPDQARELLQGSESTTVKNPAAIEEAPADQTVDDLLAKIKELQEQNERHMKGLAIEEAENKKLRETNAQLEWTIQLLNKQLQDRNDQCHGQGDTTKYISLRFPIISGEFSRLEQAKKVLEEFNEVGTEIESAAIDRRRAASELFDLIQAFVGLIRTELVDLLIDDDVDRHLISFFANYNKLHIEKIMRYAKERGWTVIGA